MLILFQHCLLAGTYIQMALCCLHEDCVIRDMGKEAIKSSDAGRDDSWSGYHWSWTCPPCACNQFKHILVFEVFANIHLFRLSITFCWVFRDLNQIITKAGMSNFPPKYCCLITSCSYKNWFPSTYTYKNWYPRHSPINWKLQSNINFYNKYYLGFIFTSYCHFTCL